MDLTFKSIHDRAVVYVKHAISTTRTSTLKEVYSYCHVEFLDGERNTPLHYAAKKGKRQALWWLLRHTNLNPMAVNAYGQNAAHIATIHGQLGCLQDIMVNCDAKALLGSRDAARCNIPTIAEQKGYLKILAWLHEHYGTHLQAIKEAPSTTNHPGHQARIYRPNQALIRVKSTPKHITFLHC